MMFEEIMEQVKWYESLYVISFSLFYIICIGVCVTLNHTLIISECTTLREKWQKDDNLANTLF